MIPRQCRLPSPDRHYLSRRCIARRITPMAFQHVCHGNVLEMRLLLVEDDERIAKFLVKGLREQTYAVDRAADGEDALYKLAVNEYDLLILDLMIPGPDGFEVC